MEIYGREINRSIPSKSIQVRSGVMYHIVCKFGLGRAGGKMAFIFGRGDKISAWLRVRPGSFWDWEIRSRVLGSSIEELTSCISA